MEPGSATGVCGSGGLRQRGEIAGSILDGALRMSRVRHAIINPTLPFGGFKQSGFGRGQARRGIEAHTERKTVIIKL